MRTRIFISMLMWVAACDLTVHAGGTDGGNGGGAGGSSATGGGTGAGGGTGTGGGGSSNRFDAGNLTLGTGNVVGDFGFTPNFVQLVPGWRDADGGVTLVQLQLLKFPGVVPPVCSDLGFVETDGGLIPDAYVTFTFDLVTGPGLFAGDYPVAYSSSDGGNFVSVDLGHGISVYGSQLSGRAGAVQLQQQSGTRYTGTFGVEILSFNVSEPDGGTFTGTFDAPYCDCPTFFCE